MATYILYSNNKPVHITNESPYTGTPKPKHFDGVEYDSITDAWDYKSFEQVEELAVWATKHTGEVHLGVDAGDAVHPRFSIVAAPKIGDDISYGFNGDYYPCGKITHITKGWRCTATDEDGFKTVFNRRKNTACWKKVGGTWSMVRGIVQKQNPHF